MWPEIEGTLRSRNFRRSVLFRNHVQEESLPMYILEETMITILIIVVVLMLFGGGGYYGYRRLW